MRRIHSILLSMAFLLSGMSLLAQERPIKTFPDGVKLYRLKQVWIAPKEPDAAYIVDIVTKSGIRMEGIMVAIEKSREDVLAGSDFDYPFLWAVTTFPDGRKKAEYMRTREGWKMIAMPPEGDFWLENTLYHFNSDGTGYEKSRYKTRCLAQQLPVSETEHSYRDAAGWIYHERVRHYTGGYYFFVNASVETPFNWNWQDTSFTFTYGKSKSSLEAKLDIPSIVENVEEEYGKLLVQQSKADFGTNKEVAKAKEEGREWVKSLTRQAGPTEYHCVGCNEDIIVLRIKGSDEFDIRNYVVLCRDGAESLSAPLLYKSLYR